MNRSIAFVSLTLAVTSCKSSSEPSAAPAGSATGPAVAVAERAKSAEDLTEKMRHCPVTLVGVRTELEDVDGGIRFVIEATAPEVVTEARRRAHALAEFTAGRSTAKHGAGKGGGFMRNCPILTKDAKVVVDEIEGGVRVTGEETRARALVVVPGRTGSTVLTIGHVKNQTTTVGQVLHWKLAATKQL
ncbi:MAG: hypothetical protein ABI867_38320 [Kofleriaceae bacterium]